MLYSEAFRKMGVPGVTRGSPWAAINRDSVLVIMGHEDYFDRDQNGWFYEHPAQPGLGAVGGSDSFGCAVHVIRAVAAVNVDVDEAGDDPAGTCVDDGGSAGDGAAGSD